MKKLLTPYLFSFALICLTYLVVSLIMVSISYVTTINRDLYQMILTTVSYITIVAASFTFIHQIDSKPIVHIVLFALLYFIISLMINHSSIHLLRLIIKPILFLISGIVLTLFFKDNGMDN